jgi:hypothetical protein
LVSGRPKRQLYELDDIQTKKISAWHVIGVMRDFNFNSLHDQVSPLALSLRQESASIALRVNMGNIGTRPFVDGPFKAGRTCHPHCLADRVLGNGSMAPGFCLQDRYQLGGICPCGIGGIVYRF